ncbi:MAG: glycosyl hydrolase family 28 protein [bacterium]
MMHTIFNNQSEFLSDRQKLFSVNIRSPGEAWQPVSLCNARVGLRQTGIVSIGSFDFTGTVEVSVTFAQAITSWKIRPLHDEVKARRMSDREIGFTLIHPRKLSIEINGDTLNNLHLFANDLETSVPDPAGKGVVTYPPGIHHIGGDGFLRLQSGQTLYLPYGAVLKTKGIVCDHVDHVRICGRGVVDLSEWMPVQTYDKTRPDTRGVCVTFARQITLEGILFLNPNHYTVYVGQSDHVSIRNIKTISSSLWADGIDCMSTTHLEVDDVFLRTSDDCIAIYGHRWDFYGDTRHIRVRNSVFWADVAHPVMIGIHGWHEKEGDLIEDVLIENIDILLHDEILEQYQGALAVNAGDANVVRDITFSGIRIEEVRAGQIFNIRVYKNDDYNPKPGQKIQNVIIRDVTYSGPDKASEISGYDLERRVERVSIQNLVINGAVVLNPEDANIRIGPFVTGVTFS